MRTVMRWLSLAVILVAVLLWLLNGPNRGWTKTSVQHDKVDEVTGLTGTTWEKRFVPGVDFVLGGVMTGALLFGVSFLFRKRQAPRI